MHYGKILNYVLYILLILANVIYWMANGYKPIFYYPQLFLYNVLLLFVVGTFIIIRLNLLLHSWFVEQKGDQKQKTKVLVSKILLMVKFILSCFSKGNQRMLIKGYFYIVIWTLLSKFIPSFLMAIILGTFLQFKGYIQQKLKDEFNQLQIQTQNLIIFVLKNLPKFNQKITAQQQED